MTDAVPTTKATYALIAEEFAVAEGESEGLEVAASYGPDAQRWFTFYREETLVPLLTAAGFAVAGRGAGRTTAIGWAYAPGNGTGRSAEKGRRAP